MFHDHFEKKTWDLIARTILDKIIIISAGHSLSFHLLQCHNALQVISIYLFSSKTNRCELYRADSFSKIHFHFSTSLISPVHTVDHRSIAIILSTVPSLSAGKHQISSFSVWDRNISVFDWWNWLKRRFIRRWVSVGLIIDNSRMERGCCEEYFLWNWDKTGCVC